MYLHLVGSLGNTLVVLLDGYVGCTVGQVKKGHQVCGVHRLLNYMQLLLLTLSIAQPEHWMLACFPRLGLL